MINVMAPLVWSQACQGKIFLPITQNYTIKTFITLIIDGLGHF
jgi:hypothetical protein